MAERELLETRQAKLEKPHANMLLSGGYGCLWAGVIALFVNVNMQFSGSESNFSFALVRFALMGGIALGLMACLGFRHQAYALIKNKISAVLVTALGLCVMPTYAIVDSAFLPLPFQSALVVAVASGILIGISEVVWADRLSEIDEASVRPTIVGAIVLAGALVTVVSLFREPFEYVSVLLLACVSCAMLFVSFDGQPNSDTPFLEEKRDYMEHRISVRSKSAFPLIIDGLALGSCSCLVILAPFSHGLQVTLVGTLVVLVALMFFLLSRIKPDYLSVDNMQLIILPIFTGCLLLTLFIYDWPQIVLSCLLLISLGIVSLSNIDILVLRGNLLSLSSFLFYARGRIFIVLGQMLGWLAGAFIVLDPDVIKNFSISFVVAMIVLFSAQVSLSTLRKESRETKEAEELRDAIERESRNSFKQRCNAVAEHYGLSPRENEVLFYLAKGYTAKHIADTFFVAEKTVKSHIYHVYQKMGVHSQQTLISMVESVQFDDEGHVFFK